MVVGWAKAKLRSREGRSREKRKGDREKEGKKTTRNKGMTSGSIPCYIRAE